MDRFVDYLFDSVVHSRRMIWIRSMPSWNYMSCKRFFRGSPGGAGEYGSFPPDRGRLFRSA